MKNNNFEIEFELIQYTPLIHFNSKRRFNENLENNKNETFLRATELKAKYDKFLNAYCNTKNIKTKNLKQSSSNAFDYLIEIQSNLKESKEIQSPLFFGNRKPKKNAPIEEWKKFEETKKRAVWLKDIKVKFFSFNKKLINLIEESFESFLASTNFGMRTSKGFGCFYIKNKEFDTNKIYYINNDKLKKAEVFYFNTASLDKNKYKNWDEYLNLFYKFLRSGINLKDKNKNTIFYTKPVIFEYFKKELEWEKRAIKSRCLEDELNKQIEKYHSDILTNEKPKKRIIKDLFGLSTIESWRDYGKTLKKISVEKNKNKPKYKRFQSPLTFKYINNKIYFWTNENYKKILGKEFILNLSGCEDRLKIVEEFNFNEFFKFLQNLDLKNFIESKYHNRDEFKILEKIHNQLKVIK
jgi:hypothetical protein